MRVEQTLRLGHLYPKEMNLYGDRGNILAMVRRAQRRGIGLEVIQIQMGADGADLAASCSGFFIGGGQDLDQGAVAEDLIHLKGPVLRQKVAAGAPLLAVCAGFQLLGMHYLTASGTRIPGLGLLPIHTEAGSRRLVGNLMVSADPSLRLRDPVLIGFENHSGKTYLHEDLAPLGKVVRGKGNTGQSREEGAWRGSVLGTYLHGPLLPKNPELSDWWLRVALHLESLPALDDSLEQAARLEAMAAAQRTDSFSRFRLLGRGLSTKRGR
ncbi:MAG: type 1 glutamine amidotransferase [Candidatus Dormibacteria bacterium]